MKKFIIATVLFSLTFFSVNAQNWGNNKSIKGNGNVITVKRTTSDYNSIAVGGSFDVILIKGKEGNITIEGEENIIPYLETEVNGNTLKIGYKKNTNINTTEKMKVTVTVETVEAISLGGSGNINADTIIKADELSVNLGGSGNINLKVDAQEIESKIGGSGDINLSGNTNEISCAIAGSGSIKAYDLTTKIANATIAGSGSIKITVKDEIKAKIVGSGSVYYKGNPPRIDTKSMGSGSVVDKN